MRWTFFAALCLATAYAAVDDDSSALTVPRNTVMAPLHANGKIIPNEYIVVFKKDVTDDVGKV